MAERALRLSTGNPVRAISRLRATFGNTARAATRRRRARPHQPTRTASPPRSAPAAGPRSSVRGRVGRMRGLARLRKSRTASPRRSPAQDRGAGDGGVVRPKGGRGEALRSPPPPSGHRNPVEAGAVPAASDGETRTGGPAGLGSVEVRGLRQPATRFSPDPMLGRVRRRCRPARRSCALSSDMWLRGRRQARPGTACW
jgi:hypothetical protein